MSFYKIIDSEKISWNQKESAKLDYRMIFEENDSVKENKVREKKKEEIREILKENDAEWELELERAREAAYQKGLNEGMAHGYQSAHKEIDHKFTSLERMFKEAYSEWRQWQKELEPGLLDTVFFLAEKILEIPVENEVIREQMEKRLTALLRKLDPETRPTLLVSQKDYEFVSELVQKSQSETVVHLGIGESCNSGEFIFETDREMAVHKFRLILEEFRKSLTTLPTWR